jgi:hypothetical protein
MALAPLITATMLRYGLSTATYMALYDEEQLGVQDEVDVSGPVLLTLTRAHIRCVSWLGANYNKIPLVTDPDVSELLKDAELNYAIGISYDMHPEYVRAYGEEPKRKAAYDQAELTMMRIQEAILKLVDSASMAEPTNVGGIVVDSGQRMFLGTTNGIMNSGDF